MNELIPQEISERLRSLISDMNLNFVETASLLGMKKQAFHAYLSGIRIPPTEALYKLSTILNVSMEYILTGKDTHKLNEKPKHNDEEKDEISISYSHLSDLDKERIKHYIEVCTIASEYQSNTQAISIEDDFAFYDVPNKDTIPILGKVAAGLPFEIIQVPLGYLKSSINADYALIVKGESMNPVIQDGEYVFVKQTTFLEYGEIGVFYIDGETTCKLFYKESDTVVLKSFNSSFQPFKYSLKSSSELRILGKVILTQKQKERHHFFS